MTLNENLTILEEREVNRMNYANKNRIELQYKGFTVSLWGNQEIGYSFWATMARIEGKARNATEAKNCACELIDLHLQTRSQHISHKGLIARAFEAIKGVICG